MPLARASLAALLCLATTSAADGGPRSRTHGACREHVDRVLAGNIVDVKPEHRDVLCDHFSQKIAEGLPERGAWDWLGLRLRDIAYAWAPLGAREKPGTVYRLPYAHWIPRLCSQAAGGETHKTLDEYHAFDFLMPIGTEVLAAREGVVVEVEDGVPEGVPWEERTRWNGVTVLHRDGTFAAYGHLTPGIPVRPGQNVAIGQRIGYSGNTGYSRTPHLHFVVRARTKEGEVKAIPIRFTMPGRHGFDLEAGHHHGVVPTSKRTLRLLLDGKPVEDGEKPIPIRYGDEAALRVELVERDGTVRDVTRQERIRYETMTVWNLWVPEPGRIQAAVVPGVDDVFIKRTLPLLNQSEGLLFVYHGVPRDPDFGFARLTLAIDVSSAAPVASGAQ